MATDAENDKQPLINLVGLRIGDVKWKKFDLPAKDLYGQEFPATKTFMIDKKISNG